MFQRSLEALQLLLIKKAKIPNLNDFIMKNDRTQLIITDEEKKKSRISVARRTSSVRLRAKPLS